MHPLRAVLLTTMLLLAGRVSAQFNSTLYFMRDLPVRNQLNPALQPEAGTVFFGIPMLASIHVDAGATMRGMNYSNLMSSRPQLKQMAANVNPFEGAYMRADYSLFNLGVEIRDMYFTLDVTSRVHAEVNIPGDVVRLGWSGNGPYLGRSMSLGGFGEYMDWYTEIALGFAKEVLHRRMSIGGRVKRLMGMAMVDAHLAPGSYFYTDPNSWNITTSMIPDISVAGLDMNIPRNGAQIKDFVPNLLDINRQNELFSGSGWGVDLGFELKNDYLNVSGSLLNFGAITWERTTHAVSQGEVVHHFNGTLAGPGTNVDVMQSLMDTITSISALSLSYDDILRWTSPTIAFGATYKISEHFNAGMLGAVTIGQYNTYPQFSAALSTQSYPINATVSYTYIHHSNNLGLGLVFGRNGLQFHAITDNLIALNYERVQKANIRVGLTLLLGERQSLTGHKKALGPLYITPNGDDQRKRKEKSPGPIMAPNASTSSGATPKKVEAKTPSAPLNATPPAAPQQDPQTQQKMPINQLPPKYVPPKPEKK
jgi:hypothetical protein